MGSPKKLTLRDGKWVPETEIPYASPIKMTKSLIGRLLFWLLTHINLR